MPQGRSTFTKRQKERTRQQKQQEKAERRNQRKQEKGEASSLDDINELSGNADAQAALFHVGSEEPASLDQASPPRQPTGA